MNIGESIVINLAARYGSAFGIMAVNKAINQTIATRVENDYQIEIYADIDDAFEEIKFLYTDKTKIKPVEKSLKFGKMLENDGSGSIYAPPLMINFSREKNLIETNVSGSDDVVIENWGTKPWNIDMQGILIDIENRHYPSKKITELTRIFEHNDIIKVIGKQFLDKDIYSIFIRNISISPVEGFQDTIQFTINASSIKEVSWTLLEPN